MKQPKSGFRRLLQQLICVGNLFLLTTMTAGCANTPAPDNTLTVKVAFEVNGTFILSMSLPTANTEGISDQASFFAIESATSQLLFRAKYDPGWGKDRGILLTTIWATVRRFPDPELSDSDNQFERVKAIFSEKNTDWNRYYSFGDTEFVNGRAWLTIMLKGGISSGMALATEFENEYALVVGVRVFGDSEKISELRDHRLHTLKKIVESIQIEALSAR